MATSKNLNHKLFSQHAFRCESLDTTSSSFMSRLALYLGLILIAAGLVSYTSTGMQSVTALIPSLFGLAFLVLGLIGKINEKWRRHTTHIALLIALLGLGGSVRGLVTLVEFILSIDRFAAVITQSFMAVSCIYFIFAGLKSFISARFGPSPESEPSDRSES